VSFIPNVFSQSEHPFDQCGHFNQVEPFEKSKFLIVIGSVTTKGVLVCQVISLDFE